MESGLCAVVSNKQEKLIKEGKLTAHDPAEAPIKLELELRSKSEVPKPNQIKSNRSVKPEGGRSRKVRGSMVVGRNHNFKNFKKLIEKNGRNPAGVFGVRTDADARQMVRVREDGGGDRNRLRGA